VDASISGSLESNTPPSSSHPMESRSAAATVIAYEAARVEWRQHPAYRRTIAQHFVEDVHPMFREMFNSVEQALSKREKKGETPLVDKQVQRMFHNAWSNLEHHHQAEDRLMFPRLREFAPTQLEAFDVLEDDHKRLYPLKDAVLSSLDNSMLSDEDRRRSLSEFIALLMDHLNREELLVVPMFMNGAW